MEIGKFKFRIMVIIFIIALLVPVVMIVKEEISVSMSISNTKKILSNIKAEEMQEEIIERLKNSQININTSSLETQFEVFQEVDKDILKKCTHSTSDYKAKDFVFAFITDKEEEKGVAIPLFKIVSDSDGKFKNIEYVSGDEWFNGYMVVDAINDVLKTEYGLEKGMGYYGMRYEEEYYGPMHEPSIIGDDYSLKYTDSDFAKELIQKMNKGNYEEYYYASLIKEADKSVIWGLLD